MFTHEELSFLKEENYQLARKTDEYVEFRSRNTGHCWIIKKEPFDLKYPYSIFHKHKLTDSYHRHWQSYSVEKCIESICNHDAYVLRIESKLLSLRNNSKKRRCVKWG